MSKFKIKMAFKGSLKGGVKGGLKSERSILSSGSSLLFSKSSYPFKKKQRFYLDFHSEGKPHSYCSMVTTI
jgi:hypothetical protein